MLNVTKGGPVLCVVIEIQIAVEEDAVVITQM